MMNKFKNIVAILILLLGMPFMQSCLDDNDDVDGLPGNDYIPLDATMATVITSGEVSGEVVIEDDKTGLAYVVNPSLLTYQNANNEGQRIFYTANSPNAPTGKSGTYIELKTVYKVLTKNMDTLAEDEEDVYGKDPISIVGNPYISNKHLTISFKIWAASSSVRHRISLVAAADAAPDANGYIGVEFRHNAEGDGQAGIASDYVSFTLESIPGFKEGKLKGFRIKMNTLDKGTIIQEISINSSNTKCLNFNIGQPFNTKTK